MKIRPVSGGDRGADVLRGGLTMRIVIVEQGRKPYETELERDLESMQHCVGGTIEAVYEPGGRDAALICVPVEEPCQ